MYSNNVYVIIMTMKKHDIKSAEKHENQKHV